MKSKILKTSTMFAALLIPQIAQAQITLQEFEVVSEVNRSVPVNLSGGAGIFQIAALLLLGVCIYLMLRGLMSFRKKE